MAVFTELEEQDIDQIVSSYGLPLPTTICGIADGKNDSTYLIVSGGQEYIATIFEGDVSPVSLDDTFRVMEFLSERGFPCPVPLRTISGDASIGISAKIAALVGFVPGVSTKRPSAQQCESLARRTAELHLLLGPAAVATDGLTRSTVHGALYAENVFFLDSNVGGIINYRHRREDYLISELADLVARYAVSDRGQIEIEKARSLVGGYSDTRSLTGSERAELPSFVFEAVLQNRPATENEELRRRSAAGAKECISFILTQSR